MVHKLFNIGKKSGTVAIVFLLTNALACSATEYVFTAPPEAGREAVEIPESEEEYPLYECERQSNTEENDVFDSHDCICEECEDLSEDESSEQSESYAETDAE